MLRYAKAALPLDVSYTRFAVSDVSYTLFATSDVSYTDAFCCVLFATGRDLHRLLLCRT